MSRLENRREKDKMTIEGRERERENTRNGKRVYIIREQGLQRVG